MESILRNANNTLIRYFEKNPWLNLEAKVNFAKSLVRSRINYGLLIYLNATRLNRFEKLNNDVMRTILNLDQETNLEI